MKGNGIGNLHHKHFFAPLRTPGVVIAAIIACIAVAVLLLTNPAKTLELPVATSVISIDKLKGKTWATNYLQGSTGASITTVSLIETLLQTEHNGDWIDGVRFLYHGSPCEASLFPTCCWFNTG